MLHIFRQSFVDDLYLKAADMASIKTYREGTGAIPVAPAALLSCDIKTEGSVPALVVESTDMRAKNDADNARNLYLWLRPRNWRQGNDPRLWTYLSHEVFPDYCRQRWPIRSDEKAVNLIRSRWILRGESRGAVSRHSIARLWWAADITWRPSRHIPELVDFENEHGEWWFTNRLLLNQDAFQALRERKFGSNPRVLLAALMALKNFDDSLGPAARHLCLALNLVGRFQILDSLNWSELVSRCKEILSDWRVADDVDLSEEDSEGSDEG